MSFARIAGALLIGASALTFGGTAAFSADTGTSFGDFSKMKAQPGSKALEGARLPGEAEDAPGTFNSPQLGQKEPEWVPLDMNENGKVDGIGLDSNGDGYFDVVLFDEDEDGEIEAGIYDLDNNGTIDMVLSVEANTDGTMMDVYGVDEDEDGKPDFYGYDYDQDGNIDEWKEETA